MKLGLESADAVNKAVTDIITSVKKAANVEIEYFLVESMIANPRDEYIIGIKRQAALGLALMIGRGGSAAESMNTYATILLPLVEADLKVAMECVGLNSSTTGYDEMLQAITAVASYAIKHADQLESLDVNPVIVTADGKAIATDVLIVTRETG